MKSLLSRVDAPGTWNIMPITLADNPKILDNSGPPPVGPASLSPEGISRFVAIFCIFSAIAIGFYWRYLETDRPTTIASYQFLQQQLTKAADQSSVVLMRFDNLSGKRSAVAAFSYFLGNYVVYPRRIIVGQSPDKPVLNSAEDILMANCNATNEWAAQHGAGISFTISSNGGHLSVDQQSLHGILPKAATP
jgi:hypothetical protein